MMYVAFLAGGYALAVTTWVLYLAIMSLYRVRHDLSWVARGHAYPLLAVGFVFDCALNVLVGSVLFLKHPQDWLLTHRLTRYLRDPDELRWRKRLALWLCTNLLDPFDPSGDHCGCRELGVRP